MVRFTKRNGCLSFCSQRFVLCAIICFVLYYLTFYNDNRHHLTKSTGTVTEYVTRGDSRTKTNNDTDADHGVGNRRFVDAKDNLYGAAGKIAGNIGAAGIVGEGHGDDKVTIAIVDQHQEVIPYWYQAVKEGKIAPSQNTLIHFDGHSDLAPPDDYQTIQHFVNNTNINNNNKLSYLPLMQRNDRFIVSAILAGLINRVIWIQPGWLHPKNTHSNQTGLIGTVIPGKGRESGEGKLCFCYQNKKTCGYFTFQNKQIKIPRKACRKLKSFSYQAISETLVSKTFKAENLKKNRVILDIDEDYFGVESGVQMLMNAGVPLDTIYVIDELLAQLFCPKSIMAEEALDKELRMMFSSFHVLFFKKKKKPSTTRRIVLKHVSKYLCHKNDSTSLQPFVSYLDSKMTMSIASALSNTKYCLFNSLQLKTENKWHENNKLSDFSLCHGVLFPGDEVNEIFVDTRDGIEKRGENLSKMLDFIFESVTPNLITVARSLRDGYVPRRQQRFIEHNIRKAIETNLSKRKIKSEMIFDENLVGGKEGWELKALEF